MWRLSEQCWCILLKKRDDNEFRWTQKKRVKTKEKNIENRIEWKQWNAEHSTFFFFDNNEAKWFLCMKNHVTFTLFMCDCMETKHNTKCSYVYMQMIKEPPKWKMVHFIHSSLSSGFSSLLCFVCFFLFPIDVIPGMYVCKHQEFKIHLFLFLYSLLV